MKKSIFTLIIVTFVMFSCKEEKKKRIKVEEQLTSSQLETIKELKGYKLGTEYERATNSNYSFGKNISTSVSGLDGTINFFTTNQNVIYKMEFVSKEYLADYDDQQDKFVNAIKNRYKIPKTNQWGNVNSSDFIQFINDIEYKVENKGTLDSNYLMTVSKFSMTDSKLEKQKDSENQEKANSDF